MSNMFDSPNDIHWQDTIRKSKRENTQTYLCRVLDPNKDGNYTDNLIQRFTVEVMGWGMTLGNCRPLVNNAGYNGTGDYVNYKVGDVVIGVAREGQLDDMLLMGGIRINGNNAKLEKEGKNQKFNEYYQNSYGLTRPSNPPSFHPSRVTKIDSNIFLGPVNNIEEEYIEPTSKSIEENLKKQYIPGLLKGTTKEGVDINYSLGGWLQMTDGNAVVVSTGTTQSKCNKYLRQSLRHAKIATILKEMEEYGSVNLNDALPDLENIEFGDVETSALIFNADDFPTPDNITQFNPNFSTFKIDGKSDLINPLNNKELKIGVTKENLEGRNNLFTPFNTYVANKNKEKDDLTTDGILLRSPNYRAKKHEELAEIATAMAEECNTNGGAFQYMSNVMGMEFGNHLGLDGLPTPSPESIGPLQLTGNVNPNNYSSRSNSEFKKPTVIDKFLPQGNYSTNTHTPKFISMHHTNRPDIQSTYDILVKNKTSAHYAVDRDGKIYQLVPDKYVAYHNKGFNSGSIGIENVATETAKGLTFPQERSLIELVKYLVNTYSIPESSIFGHQERIPTPKDATACPTYIFPTPKDLDAWVKKYIFTSTSST